MPTTLKRERPFGRTGVTVPLIGYGTAILGEERSSRESAIRCLNHAIDRGITYLDTSPDYRSEERIGEVMRDRRSEVFLATKVNRRSRSGVLEEIQQSLERLQSDYVDLIQVHGVNAWADLEQTVAPDGAVAGLEEARAQGWVRFIGITGHARPELLAVALEQQEFDSVLAALGIADHLVAGADQLLLPVAQKRETAVLAMKVLGHGNIKEIDLALRYSLGLPGVSMAVIGMHTVEQIDQIVEAAAHVEPLEEQERSHLIQAVQPLVERDARESKSGKSPLFWLHDTKVMGWQTGDTPSDVSY